MVVVYISLYLNAKGLSIKDIGTVLTLFGLFGVLGGYCGGLATNYISPISICKLSLLISPVLFFSLSFVNEYYLFIIITSLLGFMTNIFRPAYILVLAQDENPHYLEKVVALRRVAMNLGMAVGAGIGGFIAHLELSLIFAFYSLSSIVAFLIIFKIKGHENFIQSKTKESSSATLNSSFYFMLLLMFFILIIFNQSLTIYPLFLKNNMLLNERAISILFMISGIIIALFQVPITIFFQNKNAYTICSLGTFLICLGFTILPWCNSYSLVILSCLLWTFGEIILFPTQLVMLIKLSGNNKGQGMGIYQMVFSLASFLSPAVGTTFYAFNENSFWYLSGIVGLLLVPSFWFAEKGILKSRKNPDIARSV
jgi:predicted MFS family arabinose efflux permease